MQRFLLAVSALLFAGLSTAQKTTPKDWEKIQSSENYIIGMGTADALDDARQMALSDLSGKISTRVESQFSYVMSQQQNGKHMDTNEQMGGIIRSYSAVTLSGVSEYIAKEKPQYVVYRYMKTSELRAMFKRRLELAKKWAREASEREHEGKVGDALQEYYWALALLRSCPDGDLETLDGADGGSMIPTIFSRVKDILGRINIRATQSEREGNQQRVTLDIRYGNLPAVNFNYKYFDGKQYSDTYTAKDGTGEVVLPAGVKLSKLKLHAEYECREEANIHPDLRNVMAETAPVPFQAAILPVDTKGCAMQNDYVMQIAQPSSGATPEPTASSSTTPDKNGATQMDLSAQEAAAYLPTMQAIEQGVAHRNYDALRSHFTDEGWEMFSKLVTYGDAKLLRSPEVSFQRNRGEVVCRSFPMSFSFRGNRRTFTEDVVFYLNSDHKVCEVAFGLEQAAVNDILCRGDWSEEARQVMVHFLETYKTAYALKRWDYINSIFSNEALIITGSVVKASGQKEIGPAKMQHVKYSRQTKEQYMNSLRRCFASNEYINIHFADNIVRRSHTKPDVYGIQIKQDYFSSTYGDTGYLFLLIDFEHPETPVIHVRTWQPDNDPNIRDGRIGIADFLL